MKTLFLFAFVTLPFLSKAQIPYSDENESNLHDRHDILKGYAVPENSHFKFNMKDLLAQTPVIPKSNMPVLGTKPHHDEIMIQEPDSDMYIPNIFKKEQPFLADPKD